MLETELIKRNLSNYIPFKPADDVIKTEWKAGFGAANKYAYASNPQANFPSSPSLKTAWRNSQAQSSNSSPAGVSKALASASSLTLTQITPCLQTCMLRCRLKNKKGSSTSNVKNSPRSFCPAIISFSTWALNSWNTPLAEAPVKKSA